MPKNANRMGTVRKRADGRWEGRYTAPDGKQRSVYGKTQKAATEALRAAQRDIDGGTWLQPSTMTMDAWLTAWLRDYQSHTTGRTVTTYASEINCHMRPVFGSVRLVDFSAVHVRRMIAAMTDAGLSPTTIRHVTVVLSASMRDAVKDGLIKSNPVTGVKAPKPAPLTYTIIDREQIPAFVDAIQATACPDALLFLLLTGARSGEARGLKWQDIDWDAGTVHIQRQLYVPSYDRAEFRPPKDGEVRRIHVAPEVLDLLRRHRKAQAADRLRASAWIETDFTRDLVFRQPNGRPLGTEYLDRAIRRVRDALNLPGLRVHDLRHSYAVAALRSGVDVKTVQHNLGHRSAAMTLDIYAAYTDDAGRTGAEKLSAYLSEALH